MAGAHNHAVHSTVLPYCTYIPVRYCTVVVRRSESTQTYLVNCIQFVQYRYVVFAGLGPGQGREKDSEAGGQNSISGTVPVLYGTGTVRTTYKYTSCSKDLSDHPIASDRSLFAYFVYFIPLIIVVSSHSLRPRGEYNSSVSLHSSLSGNSAELI